MDSGQIVGERGGTAFPVPFHFWRGNVVPLAYATAVGGRGGMWLGVPPRPLHHQLVNYGQFFARKPQVLLHSSDCAITLLLLALLT